MKALLFTLVLLISSCTKMVKYRNYENPEKSLTRASIYLIQESSNYLDVYHSVPKFMLYGSAGIIGGAAGLASAKGPAVFVGLGVLTGLALGTYLISREMDKSEAQKMKQCLSSEKVNDQILSSLRKNLMGSNLLMNSTREIHFDNSHKELIEAFNKDPSNNAVDIYVLYKLHYANYAPTDDPLTNIIARVIVYDRNEHHIIFDNPINSYLGLDQPYTFEDLRAHKCKLANEQLSVSSNLFADLLCDKLGLQCSSHSVRPEDSVWAK